MIQLDILWATGNKFFPGWDYLSGADEDAFWIRLFEGEQLVELRVPRGTLLADFEATVWLDFDRLRNKYDLELASAGA